MKVIHHVLVALITFLGDVTSFSPILTIRRSSHRVSSAATSAQCAISRRGSLDTSLQASCSVDALTAAGSIVASTCVGMTADKKVRYLRGAGTMITILVASHFSNLGLAPTSHHLYELCWSKFLPASLALLLLSPSMPEDEQGKVDTSTSTPTTRTRDAAREEISAVSIPFIIGCLGSIVGCLVSYLMSELGRENHSRRHSHILVGRKHFYWLPGHLLLKPTEAAVAAGCLCASYIGGSVNYFATARIIAKSVDIPDFDGTTGVLGGTFGSSASDLLIMALYFSTVTASLSSAILQRWFPGRVAVSQSIEDDDNSQDLTQSDIDELKLTEKSWRRRVLAKILLKKRLWRRRLFALSIVLPLSFGIVEISDVVDVKANLPGMGSLSISVLATVSSRILQKSIAFYEARRKRGSVALLKEINSISGTMSDICFYMLFAAIGSTANLGDAIRNGGWHSASSFIFAAVALLVHIVVIITGSLGVEKLFPAFRFFPLGIDEVMVASNAGIGGPVTAAAVAAGMATEEDTTQSRRKGLILAASVWGVVGYAVATFIGVSMSKMLLTRLLNS